MSSARLVPEADSVAIVSLAAMRIDYGVDLGSEAAAGTPESPSHIGSVQYEEQAMEA